MVARTAEIQRKKKRGLAPFDRSASSPALTVAADPGSPIDPATLSSDLQYQWERVRAIILADKFERWLIELANACGVRFEPSEFNDWLNRANLLFVHPDAEVFRAIALGRLYLEAMLLTKIENPDLFGIVEGREDGWGTEPDSFANGMRIRVLRRGKKKRSAANLPGCHGIDEQGIACIELRRFGHLYCPTCEEKEVRRMRSNREG